MYSIGLQVLRAKLRGFQAAGSSISHRISKSKTERKNKLWNKKRALGVHCRNHLVAYGLLRGIPYLQIEQCAPNNKLNPQVILDIMTAHNGVVPIRRYGDKMVGGGYIRYDLETVTKLLEGGVGQWVKQPNGTHDWVVQSPILKAVSVSAAPTSEPSSVPTETPKPKPLKRLLEKRA